MLISMFRHNNKTIFQQGAQLPYFCLVPPYLFLSKCSPYVYKSGTDVCICTLIFSFVLYIFSESSERLQLFSTSCSEGVITWQSPSDVVGLLFQTMVQTDSDTIIDLCFKTSSIYTNIIVQTNSTDDITNLDANETRLDSDEYCIRVRSTRIALQLSSIVTPQNSIYGRFAITYDVQKRPNTKESLDGKVIFAVQKHYHIHSFTGP